MELYTLLSALPGVVAGLSTGYLLLLLAAAAVAQRKAGGRSAAVRREPSECWRVAVLVPAHNEEPVLGATLASLRAQRYPEEYLETVVIADNCTDGTAEVARKAKVTLLERTDPVNRGKGYALNWAVANLLARPEPPDAFIIVDADTWVASDFVSVMTAVLASRQDASGCCALQGRYGVLNPGSGWRTRLMEAAFELFNHVRPLGSDHLGFSVGLKGNGMAFTRAVLERAPWEGRSITEDIDYGLDLLLRLGLRVSYVPEARVLAQMPVTSAQAASQRERWERGRYALLRERVPQLLLQGLRKRDLRLCDAAFQLLLLPLAELCGLVLVWGVLLAAGSLTGLLALPLLWLGLYLAVAVGVLGYVLGGLALAGATREVYLALLRAPAYAIWKCVLYATRFFRPSRQTASPEWVRTERVPIPDLSPETVTGPLAAGGPER